MAIQVKCPSCGKTLRAKDELAGKRGKCPGCGAVVMIARQSTSPTLGPVDTTAERVDDPSRALRHCGLDLLTAPLERMLEGGAIAVCLTLFALLATAVHSLTHGEFGALRRALPKLVPLVIALWLLFSLILSFKSAVHVFRRPKLASPKETLSTLFDAAWRRLWRRAYNCLTDSARAAGIVDWTALGSGESRSTALQIHSLHSFRRFMRRLDDWWVCWEGVVGNAIDEHTVHLVVPLSKGNPRLRTRGQRETESACTLSCVAVERGGYWFLTSRLTVTERAPAPPIPVARPAEAQESRVQL